MKVTKCGSGPPRGDPFADRRRRQPRAVVVVDDLNGCVAHQLTYIALAGCVDCGDHGVANDPDDLPK